MALQKLKIQSFDSPACTGNPLKTIYATVNPESYVREFKPQYEDLKIIGDPAKSLFFAGMGDNDLTITKMIVDGTGVVPLEGASNVDEYISMFQNTVYSYKGDLHSACYLKLTWGARNLTFKGVCTSLKIDYKLFNPDGSTLRAFIDLTVKKNTDFKTKEMEAKKSSPDLTHIRTVNAGDNLPLMVSQIYGDSSYYTQVARANNLNSIYDIKPGDKIFFPPIKK